MGGVAVARRGAALRMGPVNLAFLMPGVGLLHRGAEAFVGELTVALAREPGFAVTLYCRGEVTVPGVRTVRIGALPGTSVSFTPSTPPPLWAGKPSTRSSSIR